MKYKKVNGKFVVSFEVHGSRYNTVTVYKVYEDYNDHATLTWIDEYKVGAVGTSPLPDEINALPAGSDERVEAIKHFRKVQYDECYSLIEQTFPEVNLPGTYAYFRKEFGEIETVTRRA